MSVSVSANINSSSNSTSDYAANIVQIATERSTVGSQASAPIAVTGRIHDLA
jgi:hypothetical protein